MRFILLLLWVGGTIWGVGQIISGVQSGNTGQVVAAVALGVICTLAVSIIFNWIGGKTWTGSDRV